MATIPRFESPYAYLHPGYWNGHTLGHGNATDVYEASQSHAAGAYAREVLQDQVNMFAAGTQTTLARGESFLAANHAPGTVIVMREETVMGDPLNDDGLARASAYAVPEGLTEVMPCIGQEVSMIDIHIPGMRYISRLVWGVVPAQHPDKLVRTSASQLICNEDGSLTALPLQELSGNMPVVVGKTRHQAPGENKAGVVQRERIWRVNALRIMRRGVLASGSRSSR